MTGQEKTRPINAEPRPGRKRRWVWRILLALGVLAALLAGTVLVLVESGRVEEWARVEIIRQIETTTGTRVELGAFRIHAWQLRAELENLTLHGLEPEGMPPLFHADLIAADARMDSLWRRKFSLDEVRIEKPSVHLRVERNGRSNVPAVQREKGEPGKPFRERIFDFVVRKVRLNGGEALINDVRIPLVVEGDELNFAMDYHRLAPSPVKGAAESVPAAAENSAEVADDFYQGAFTWKQVKFAARRFMPVASNVLARFTLTRQNVSVDEFRLELPHSRVEARAAMKSFAEPDWSCRYRGRLDLGDLRFVLRRPGIPRGQVDIWGQGTYANRQAQVHGSYSATGIALDRKWFTSSGMASEGDYVFAGKRVVVEPFSARALGGTVDGRVEVNLEDLAFRVDSKARGMDLYQVLAAIDHEGFPVAKLDWDAEMDVDSVTTWVRDFKLVESKGVTTWKPQVPAEEIPQAAAQHLKKSLGQKTNGSEKRDERAGKLPVTARIEFDYSMRENAVDLGSSAISTPNSRITMQGKLGEKASGLAVEFQTTDLREWNGFIQTLRGVIVEEEVERARITGEAEWRGQITGAVDSPVFSGTFAARNAGFNEVVWDGLGGEVTYSALQLKLDHARGQRAGSTIEFDLWLEQSGWLFRDSSMFTLDASVVRAPIEGLQAVAGVNYPMKGLLTGQFRGGGTRADPHLTGLVDLAEVEAWGFKADRVRGKLELTRGQVEMQNAEIRVATGRITGDAKYVIETKEAAFDVTGAVVPLDQLSPVQGETLPVGGVLSFRLSGRGPIERLQSEGTMRVVDLKLGNELVGSFEGNLHSDGREVRLELASAMEKGKLSGNLQVTLSGDYPMKGDLSIQELDLDALIKAVLKSGELTGHSLVDGRFQLSGELAKPESITVDADISRINFNYQYVNLQNDGPLRFRYSREELNIEQARLKGKATDLQLSGFARFSGNKGVGLNLTGSVNLALVGGFVKELETSGEANINGTVEGTLDDPRVTGALEVKNASATFAEFPTGLSNLSGVFVFNQTRLVLQDVRGEAGGGNLELGGTVNYGEGPLRYDLTANATNVRIRYPVGMSWHASAQLRFNGTTTGATVSGRVVVDRVLLTSGLDFSGFLGGERGGARYATSEFLRNLQFDVEVASSPDARLEWTEARFDTEASLRVRGTWEHPIMLGQIRLLSGEITFRGNRYRLTRGDLNFASALHLVPRVNIEAVTTIRQYEVSLSVTGPADQLVLSYRSDPPLPSADIVALLALGRTTDEAERRTSGAQQQELGAATLLGEAASSLVGGRIEKLFGISRFKIDPFQSSETTSGAVNSPRITIEQQVTRDLVITYSTNVTSTEQQIIQVEYTLSRKLSIVGRRDQNGTIGLDIKFTKRLP